MHSLNYLIAAIFFLLFSPLVQSRTDGFSIDLIHRNSPLSPFYNHSKTQEETLNEAYLSSMSRVKHFQNLVNQRTITPDVFFKVSSYLMKISIGNPAVEQVAVVDTGSDLIWFQCQPCFKCYIQDSPLFDSTSSSSYKALAFDSQPCKDVAGTRGDSGECSYEYNYFDDSFTKGVLSNETLVFDSGHDQKSTFLDKVFGCGHYNGGTFVHSGTSGVVGLGPGPLSLVSQLAEENSQRKFSYCLVPTSSGATSKLKLGREATIIGNGVVSTPIISAPVVPYYILTLEGISVNSRNLQPSDPVQGNIVIDSGATFTFLEQKLYERFEATVEKESGIKFSDKIYGITKLRCYKRGYVWTPDIVFRFPGAAIRLYSENAFIEIGDDDCLAIVPGRLSLFGSLAQVNYKVAYDLDAKQISFARATCARPE